MNIEKFILDHAMLYFSKKPWHYVRLIHLRGPWKNWVIGLKIGFYNLYDV